MWSVRRKQMKISDKTYDTLKLVALIAVPLFAFIGALCTIWKVPHSEQITASLTALDTLLGALVAIIAKEYNKVIPSEHDNEVDAMGSGEAVDYEDGEEDE
jgi:hypothetical protein